MSHTARIGRPAVAARVLLLSCLALHMGCAMGSKKKPASAAEVAVVEEPVAPAKPKAEITEVASFDDKLATTVAISKSGRKFVSFPRWMKDNEPVHSVAEIGEQGALQPFPDAAWNTWKEGDKVVKKLVCVQAVTVDEQDRLWILDAGAPYWGKVLKGAPKLVVVDLATNKVVKTIAFDAKIAPEGAYLNDVRIDPTGNFAYLSDSNLGRIVVVDLKRNKSRFVLDAHASTKFEEGVLPKVEGMVPTAPDGGAFKVNVDGIAIAGDYLYYHAISGRTMHRIKLDLLRDAKVKPEALAAAVEKVAETGVHDGIVGTAQGDVYLTQLEENGIKVLRADGTQEMIITDARLSWPDSIGIGPDGLYVTVSQLHRLPTFNGGKDARTNPYRVFRIKPVGFGVPAVTPEAAALSAADPAPAP